MPPFTGDDGLVFVQVRPVGECKLAADDALLLPYLSLLIIERLAVDEGNSAADGRHGFGFFPKPLGYRGNDIVDLAFLDVNKDQTGQAAISGEVKLANEVCLHDLHRQDDECAETDSEQDYPRLISRTI